MKKLLIFCFMVIISHHEVRACDICGCGIGASSFGILPRFQGHFIGLRAQHRGFDSHHPPLLEGSQALSSKEYINNLELWARISLHKRLQLYVNLPYQSIIKQENGKRDQYQGLGDVSLLANYFLINKTDIREYEIQQALQVGSGVKLPTGRNDIAEEDGYIIRNLQPGIGSFAIPFNVIYTVRKGDNGLHSEFNFQHFLKNKDGYQFGNRLQQSVGVFRMFRKGDFTFLPNAGINYAWAEKDSKSNVYYDTSGGQTFSGKVGLDIYLNAFSLGLQGQLPFWQYNVNGNVNIRSQIQATFLFNF